MAKDDFGSVTTQSQSQLDFKLRYEQNNVDRKDAKKKHAKLVKEATDNYANVKKQNKANIEAAEQELRLAKKQMMQDPKAVIMALSNKSKAVQDAKAAERDAKNAIDIANSNKSLEMAELDQARNQIRLDEKEHNAAANVRAAAGETKDDMNRNPGSTSDLSSSAEGAGHTQADLDKAMPEAKPGTGSNNQNSNNQGSNKVGSMKPKFSQSFYDSLHNAVTGRPQGNTLDAAAGTAKEQAQNQRNESANRQMEAQRAQQIANQNPYAEAGKIASVQNDAENRQTINNTSFAAGTGAARLRKTNAPDVQSQMAREDSQAQVAAGQREKADFAQQGAIASEGESKQFQIKSRDLTNDIDKKAALSQGQPESEETPQPEDNKPEEKAMPTGNPQHVINALLGSSKGEDLRSGNATADKELYDWAISQGVTPVTEHESKDPNAWEQEFLKANPDKGQAVIQALRQGRVGEGNDANRNFNADEMDQMNTEMKVENPPSDYRVKDIRQCLCDAKMKWIKEDWDENGMPSAEDLEWLLRQRGKFKHNDQEYDPEDYDSWNDSDGSILGAYADNIRNYVYNYKPEAQAVDPNIDPNEEHIGPMAQDIEQVNPACVKETQDGIKTVDAGRLALMNAGAIGDLARALQSIDERLKKLGV